MVHGNRVIAIIEILGGADLIISNIIAYFLFIEYQLFSMALIIGILYIVAG